MTSLRRGDWGVPLPFSAVHTRFPKPDLWCLVLPNPAGSRPNLYALLPKLLPAGPAVLKEAHAAPQPGEARMAKERSAGYAGCGRDCKCGPRTGDWWQKADSEAVKG